MKNILITGSKGQLGNEMQELSAHYQNFNYFFTDIDELDICNYDAIDQFVKKNDITIIVNCAAYTAVDKAETNIENCFQINEHAVKNIGEIAQKQSIKVIHISTDYVFDGKHYFPYAEEVTVCPTSIYGKSKVAGEHALIKSGCDSIIIRTSWLYSSYGNNFVKTMIRLGRERDQINVIADQVGTPTYAADLADVILKIIESNSFQTGIYHYSNEGVCSWYDFCKMIHLLTNIDCNVSAIETKDYPVATARPFYSVLNKSKIKSTFNISIPYWIDSLKKCINKLND